MKGYSDIQAEVGAATKDNIYTCWIILNHISVLIVQGWLTTSADIKKTEIFNGLDESLKNTKQESVKQNYWNQFPAVGATAAPVE
jgi:hypothetical protein